MEKEMEQEMNDTYEMICQMMSAMEEHGAVLVDEDVNQDLYDCLQAEISLAACACRLADWEGKELNYLGDQALLLLEDIYDILAEPEEDLILDNSGPGLLADFLALLSASLVQEPLPDDFGPMFYLKFDSILQGVLMGQWFD